MALTGADRLEQHLRGLGRTGLIAFVTAGDPSLAFTEELALALEAAGADAIELGMPFSDPLADGPTIQRSSQRALRGGVRLAHVLELGARLRRRGLKVPLLLLCYANPLLRYGLHRAAAEAAQAGFEGLLVPDMPYEEREPLEEACAAFGLAAVPFAAPTTDDARLQRIAARARGFLYCVSLTGVTGARHRLSPEAEALLRRARRVCRVPVALGFGISRPEHVQAASRHADAVIVGSALVELVEAHADRPGQALEAVMERVRELAAAAASAAAASR